MLSVAVICFDNPFLKPMEGGKRGMLSRIEALLKCNCNIDLYLLCKPNEGVAKTFGGFEGEFSGVYQFVIRDDLGTLLSIYPISVEKRYTASCADKLKNKNYDVAIYEGEHVAKYRIKDVVRAKKHVLYMHDIESSYRKELANSETRQVVKIAQSIEAKKYFKMENALADLFDTFLFVSIDEKNAFESRFSKLRGKCIYSPYATHIDTQDIIHLKEPSHKLLYVGNLKLRNNYLSVMWFVKEVFPLIKKQLPDSTLMIVGDITPEDQKHLTEGAEGIFAPGYVEDLNQEYMTASCVICPVLFGAGVKVKLIDAISSGQIVVANKKAAEGTELRDKQHLLLSDGNENFANDCVNILNNRESYESLASRGLEFVKEQHSIEHHSEILNQVLKG